MADNKPTPTYKILLGKDGNTDVTLYPDEFKLGGYFLGVRRTGKSTLLLIDPKDYEHPFGLNSYECSDKDDPLAVQYTVKANCR